MITDTSRIADEIRAALQHDHPRITHPELIAVSVDGIGTVDLRGAVRTLRQRRAAVHDARRVEGVFEVIDYLGVQPPVLDLDRDDELRVKVLEQLSSDPSVHAEHLHVKVSHGRVTLTGYVRHVSERVGAVEIARNTSGVVAVSDEIRVR
jgi:osmotically-inducible protein OsmY